MHSKRISVRTVTYLALLVAVEIVLNRFLTKLPAAFKPAKGDISLNGAYMDINESTGQAREIRIIREHCPEWKLERKAEQGG